MLLGGGGGAGNPEAAQTQTQPSERIRGAGDADKETDSSSSKHLLSTYCIPGIMLAVGPCPRGVPSLMENDNNEITTNTSGSLQLERRVQKNIQRARGTEGLPRETISSWNGQQMLGTTGALHSVKGREGFFAEAQWPQKALAQERRAVTQPVTEQTPSLLRASISLPVNNHQLSLGHQGC